MCTQQELHCTASRRHEAVGLCLCSRTCFCPWTPITQFSSIQFSFACPATFFLGSAQLLFVDAAQAAAWFEHAAAVALSVLFFVLGHLSISNLTVSPPHLYPMSTSSPPHLHLISSPSLPPYFHFSPSSYRPHLTYLQPTSFLSHLHLTSFTVMSSRMTYRHQRVMK